MYSVDEAARHYFSSRNLDYDLFVSQRATGNGFHGYKDVISLEDLQEYDTVVYWGDFLTNPLYGYGDYTRRGLRWGLSEDKARVKEQWRQLYNPANPVPGKKLVSVGTNFQQDFAQVRGRYSKLFERLERSMERIYLRDPYSVASLARELSYEGLKKLELGTDCAFLQAPEAHRADPGGTFVYFFWRSRLDDVGSLVEGIERSTGLRAVPVNLWLSLKKSQDWASTFASMREQMLNAQFVVSDTYHVCVNAMHLRKPVIGVGRAAARQIGTLGDFKKRVLFDMFDIGDHYAELGETTISAAEVLEQLLPTIDHVSDRHRSTDTPYYFIDAAVARFANSLDRTFGVPAVG